MSDSTVLKCPHVTAIVDLDYIGDRTKWLEKLNQLNALPHDDSLCVQVRAKSVQNSSLTELAKAARDTFKNRGVLLSWNGDPRLAVELGFDACHLPEAELLKIGDLSDLGLPVSASIHSEFALRVAETNYMSHVIFGPVYQPSWKHVAAQGLSRLAAITESAIVPVVAIGGINMGVLGSVQRVGASGVACLSEVLDTPHSVETILAIQSQWYCK